MRITLDNVKGKILKTAKTVIREDIEVVPKLEDVEITANGLRKVSEGYSGIGEVLVNVQSGGSGSWAGVFDDDKVYYVGDIVYYDGGIYERTKYSQMIQLPTNAEYWSLLAEVVSGDKAIHTNGPHDVTSVKTIHVAVPDENNWEGEYEDGIAYKYGALVVYNVGVYLALKDTDGTQNPTNEEYWEKLTPIWNDTSDATATAELVAYGQTFYAGGEKKAGAMKMVDSSTFSSLALQNVAEGKLEVQYYADKNAYLLNNKGQTRPGTIGVIGEPKFLAKNILKGINLFGLVGTYAPDLEDKTFTANGEYTSTKDGYKKVTVAVPETPTFDGTINIESGFTTISGSYLIDEQKAYDLLQTYGKVKIFNVKFSAGGSGSGMGDSIDFTSMTFDGTYGFIKYNDKAAFAMNGGFAEYNNNYGDGNGARVNFEEGTECRKEFKELFLSIADEYVEPENDSVVGTWLFNSVPTPSEFMAEMNFTDGDGVAWKGISSSGGNISYYGGEAFTRGKVVYEYPTWGPTEFRTIVIENDPQISDLLPWLKANATKQG